MVIKEKKNKKVKKKVKKKSTRLTKKQKALNKKARKIKTKGYIKKQAKIALKKKDSEWSALIRKTYPTCMICGKNKWLNAHHLIPREIMKTRHLLSNGVTLCAKHHKWDIYSAHKNSFWFLLQLKKKMPEKYNECVALIQNLPTA